MNEEKIANSVSESIIMARNTVFTKKVPLRLLSEGSTRNAIENAKSIVEAGYRAVSTTYLYDTDHGVYELDVEFRRDDDKVFHTFKGVSWGYGGEGPHGLLDIAGILGYRINADKVLGVEYTDLPTKGRGSLIFFFGS